MHPTDYELFALFAGPKSRRLVAKKHKVSAGAINVLLGVAFRQSSGKNTRRSAIYALNTGAKTLIRAHIAALIKAKLLASASPATVSLTLDGLGAVADFHRQLRADRRAFSQG